jgi:hypothetical protein
MLFRCPIFRVEVHFSGATTSRLAIRAKLRCTRPSNLTNEAVTPLDDILESTRTITELRGRP